MKKFVSIILLTFLFSHHLFAVKSGSYKVKKNTAGEIGTACGKAFAESFTQSYNDAVQRQRDLDQYEKILEIQYRAQLKAQREFDQYLKELDDYNNNSY